MAGSVGFIVPWDGDVVAEVFRGEYGPIDFEGATVVDIGAHVGAFAVMAARGGAARVVAVEPCPENFEVLQRNARRWPAIECVQAAAWSRPGSLTLRRRADVSSWHTATRGVLDGPAFRREGVEVPAVTLDAVLQHAGGPVDVLKIDCEGAEYEALTGAELARVRRIVGEWHRYGPERPAALREYLTACGFRADFRGPVDAAGPGVGHFTAVR